MPQRIQLSEGYTISRVINGCWQLSEGHTIKGSLDFQDVMRAFHQLTEQGLTTFDCGDIYTGVEEFLGKFVLELKNGRGVSPDKIQIHTKYVPDLDILSQVDFQYTEKIIDRSLKRLNRDVLDMVQFHWWDYETPGCLETAGHLVRLKERGKIRNIGVTNFDTKHLAQLVDAGIPIVSSQTQYSALDRRPEKGYLEYCRQHNIALLCYGTLAGGFLTERWLGQQWEEPETRSQVKYMQVLEDSLGWEGCQEFLLLLKHIADRHGVSVANVATRYILDQAGVAAAIVGVRSSRHVASNARIFTFDLEAEEMQEIRDYFSRFPTVAGEPFEQERTIGSKYRNIMWMNLNEE